LFKLFHIEEAMTGSSETVIKKNKELKGLRAEQRSHDRELEEARAEQAKARGAVMQKEKAIKKAEKSLDGKVVS
jgi:structural maintenance of chromosome 1